jgi:hypothetical protein
MRAFVDPDLQRVAMPRRPIARTMNGEHALPLNFHPVAIRASGFERRVTQVERRLIGGAGRVAPPIARCREARGTGVR